MRIVEPSFEIISWPINPLCLIEDAGRTCYKSEEKITVDSAKQFVQSIIERGHLSVIEHVSVTVRFVVDRGVSHELVRHRLATYSQESMRYCNYKGGVTFVKPPWLGVFSGNWNDTSFERMRKGYKGSERVWLDAMFEAEHSYLLLLRNGQTPQQARSVLPNSLKTEVVMTANFREWMHVFRLRTAKAAHPQMQEIMIPVCREFADRCPFVFGGICDE